MLRKRNRGETTGTEVCLRENMETYCGGNFLKSPKVMLMKSPNNGGYGVSRGLFFFTKQGFQWGNWIAYYWDFREDVGCCWDNGMLCTKWKQCPIAKDSTHKTHWPWRSQIGAFVEHPSLLSNVFAEGGYSVGYRKRISNTKPATKHLTYNLFCCKIC